MYPAFTGYLPSTVLQAPFLGLFPALLDRDSDDWQEDIRQRAASPPSAIQHVVAWAKRAPLYFRCSSSGAWQGVVSEPPLNLAFFQPKVSSYGFASQFIHLLFSSSFLPLVHPGTSGRKELLVPSVTTSSSAVELSRSKPHGNLASCICRSGFGPRVRHSVWHNQGKKSALFSSHW